MSPRHISEQAHEILEKYWIENKESGRVWGIRIGSDAAVAAELVEGGYVASGNQGDGLLELTAEGWEEALHCVRRHRLAERLMADVLNVKDGAVHEMGCVFEHVILNSVEENICALLGHPASCPHGKPIPQGPCCVSGRAAPRKLVMPLSECDPGDVGKIAYVKSREPGAMDKLTAMGILPGLTVKLLRKTPSHLFQMGESQFAIDKGLAERIYVRPTGGNGEI